MKTFNADEVFESIFERIENGEIKTTYQLRVVLESLSEQSNMKALLILEMFKRWLAERYVELLTDGGVVRVEPVV